MDIFLFHRDLRIEDNVGLRQLLKKTQKIYCFFILTKKQKEDNAYFSHQGFAYLQTALFHLSQKIQLNIIEGEDEITVIKMLHRRHQIKRLYSNFDYTPFALQRTKSLYQFCQKVAIECQFFNDYLLFQPGAFKVANFTSFWKRIIATWQKQLPSVAQTPLFTSLQWPDNDLLVKPVINKQAFFPIIRSEVFQALSRIKDDYHQKRDLLAASATSLISPALKFGIISMREAINYSVKHFGSIENALTRQMVWREFFYHSHHLHPRTTLSQPLITKFQDFPWENNRILFSKWCQGQTGFPIVDAAMHQLNETGYMHNRARMIVASFLTKNLLIDWRWGEKYFATKLVDYDPLVNNLSWQQVAGVGYGTNPFFRIFNPWLQAQKFDQEGLYQKKYLPSDYKLKPIIDYSSTRQKALQIFKDFNQRSKLKKHSSPAKSENPD